MIRMSGTSPRFRHPLANTVESIDSFGSVKRGRIYSDSTTGAEKQMVTAGPHSVKTNRQRRYARNACVHGLVDGSPPGRPLFLRDFVDMDGPGFTSVVVQVLFSPDSKRLFAAAGDFPDNTTRLRDAATGQLLAVPLGHTGPVSLGVFSPDGARVVTASNDATRRLRDTRTGELIGVLGGPPPAYARHAMIASITRFVSSGSRTRIEATPASLAG